MTDGRVFQSAPTTTHRRPRRRGWIFALVAYWTLGSIAVSVLPWTFALLPALVTAPAGLFGWNETALLAGSIALGWIMSIPIATPVGVFLGVASTACVHVTGLWAPARRRGRWWRYLGTLIAAYAAVVTTVHLLAPTATVPVAYYAVWAALLAVGSCFLLTRLERRRTDPTNHAPGRPTVPPHEQRP